MIRLATKRDEADIMAYVSEYPAENLFLIGDIETFGFDSPIQTIWMDEQEGRLEGVYLRYKNNFVAYSRDLRVDPQAIATLIREQGLQNLNMLDRLGSFVNPYLEADYHLEQCYYCVLKKPQQLQASDGRVELLDKDGIPAYAEALSQIEEFSQPYDVVCQSAKEKIEKGTAITVIWQDGKIAASAATAVESEQAGMIVSVFTGKPYRNQGYASAAVSELCRLLLQKGKTACLFYDNPAAGRIYHRLGFETIDQWDLFRKRQ